MDAKELMIGDWVQTKDPYCNKYRVVGIGKLSTEKAKQPIIEVIKE